MSNGRQDQLDPYDLHGQIQEAAEQGSERDLQTLLQEWARREREQDIIDACLVRAVMANQAKSVALLMDFGAKPDDETVNCAIERSVSTDVWQALLDHGWEINSPDRYGDPAVCGFIGGPSAYPTLIWFLSRGASAEVINERTGYNALTLAASFHPLAVVRTLLDHSDRDAVRRSCPLHTAAACSNEDRTDVLRLLVHDYGADVNALFTFDKRPAGPSRYRRETGRPLHCALLSGRREHVRFLLDSGAKVTEKDGEGRDVRAYAMNMGREHMWAVVEEWYAAKELDLPV